MQPKQKQCYSPQAMLLAARQIEKLYGFEQEV